MNTKELRIIFNDEQLETIHQSGCKVVIGKYGNTSISRLSVAWQAFLPLEQNTITWDDKFGLYASSTRLLEGAKLQQTSYSKHAAVKGRQYTLKESGVISDPGMISDAEKYTLINNYSAKNIMTVGLCQKATINGEQTTWNAISAVPVMKKHAISMEPSYRVSVWLTSMIECNTVYSTTESPKTKLHFAPHTDSIQLDYDSANGMFIAS